MPVGEERRARKATLPPPPPRDFPVIEEEVAQVLPHVGPARTSSRAMRTIALAVGAVVLVIVVVVLALGGGNDKKTTAAKADEAPAPTAETAPVVDPSNGSDQVAVVAVEASGSAAGPIDDDAIEIALPDDEGSAAATPTTELGSGSATPTPTTTPTPPTPTPPTTTTTPTPPTTTPTPQTTTTTTTATAPQVAKPRTGFSALLKNKDVVLEYDGRAAKNGAPASEQAAISKARASYATGTQRLNAGDYDGALDNYRRALSSYPGYIGAYRGMGLAYDRKGDKSNALKALRMYVSVVPSANDVAALRKRIDALSKR
jgi:hypothetical protein